MLYRDVKKEFLNVALSSLRASFKQCISDSISLCEFFERGQAATPLGDLLHKLENETPNRPLGVTLLALTPEARQAAVKWLYGQKFSVFSLQITNQVGLLEVHLKEHGYALEKSTGERLEFDDWDSFLSAVNASNVFETSSEEVKVATQVNTAVRNLQVLLPESSQFVHDSPSLMTRLVRQTNVLMVAAPPDYRLTDIDTQVVNQLKVDMGAFWPLLPVDELADDVNIPAQGWWSQHQSLLTFSPTLLTTHVNAKIPPQLAEVNDVVRETMLLMHSVTRFSSVVEAISDRYEQEISQLQSRKKREQRKTQPVEASMLDPNFWGQLRTEMGEVAASLQKQLSEQNRKRELATSAGQAGLNQLIDNLSYQDLNKTLSYKVFKLNLCDEAIQKLTRYIQQQQRTALAEDITVINQQLQNAAETLAVKCQQQLGYRPTFAVPALPESTLWAELRDSLGLELRYQGEIPQKGFIDRLSEGRKGVMVLLMIAMLLGYVGIDLRSSGWMGLLVLPIFIGAIIYTYISFNKEEQYRLDKELVRVREEISSTGRRLTNDLQRLKMNRLSDHIEQIKKLWQQQIETISREHQAQVIKDKEQNSAKARTRLQAIETQLQDWSHYRLPVQKLLSASSQLLINTRQYLSQLNAGKR